jgi:hypothetical protein
MLTSKPIEVLPAPGAPLKPLEVATSTIKELVDGLPIPIVEAKCEEAPPTITEVARYDIPQTSMYFLRKEDRYKTEKPYSLRFVPPEGFPRSNILLEKHEDMSIEDVRPTVDELSFEEHGFKILPINTPMNYGDFDDEQKIIDVYLREVANSVRDALGAVHVHIFEHTVSQASTQNSSSFIQCLHHLGPATA